MNRKQMLDWLAAAGQCARRRCPALRRKVERLGGGAGEMWEAGVCSRDPLALLGARYAGSSGDFQRWSAAAGRVLGLAAPRAAPPPSELPWLRLVWETRADRISGGGLYGAAPRRAGAARARTLDGGIVERRVSGFSRRLLRDPALGAAFSSLPDLVRVRDMTVEWDVAFKRPREGWSLRFSEPIAWPLFLRLGVARPFAESGTRTAYLNGRAAVTELAFEPSGLWAFLTA